MYRNSFSTRPKSSRKFLLVLFTTAALIASACSGAEDAALVDSPDTPTAPAGESSVPENLAFADAGQTLRVSVPTLNYAAPHELVETDGAQVLLIDLLTDGLTKRDTSDGSIVPAVAESYETSTDELTWTFQLGDAVFSDGTPIVADDVVTSLGRVAAQGSASLSGPSLWPISGWLEAGESGEIFVPGLVAIDEDTVEMTLTEPFAPLAEVLAGVAFGITPAGASTIGTFDGELPLGSGTDYVPTEIWADGLRLSGNGVDTGITTIEVLVDPGHTSFRAGETDVAPFYDPADSLDGLTGVQIQQSANAYFAMNAAIEPFDDPMVRQAIVHAIDAEELRSRFFPDAVLMRSFIPELIPGGVSDACGSACDFDPEQAETLIQASQNDGTPVTIDYIEREDGGDDQAIAEAVAEMLNNVGLDAVARARTEDGFPLRLLEGNLGLFRFGSVSTAMSPEAMIGLPFHSAGVDNFTSTSIERVDDFIDEARRTTDAEARADLYSNAEAVLFAEAVVAPLVEFNHFVVFGDRLSAVGLEPDGSLNLSQFEFVQTDRVPLDGE